MHQNVHNKNNDPRYQEPTFQQYCSDPEAPRSYQALISGFLKARVAAYVKNMPRLLKMMIPVTILSTVFNVFFWSVLNDTMWAGRGTWGRISFVPYLIGGAVYSGSRYKGATPFEIAGLTPTGKVVAPLTFGLSLLFARMMLRKKQGGSAAISEDFANVRNMRDHYERMLGVAPRPGAPRKKAAPHANASPNPNAGANAGAGPNANSRANAQSERKIADRVEEMAVTNGYIDLSNLSGNIYMRIGLIGAVVFGFLIRNPFAVPVFAILFYFSFGQGGQSDLGQTCFRVRSADGRLHDGRKQTVPLYSEGMLVMYYMAIGLFMYTAVNVVLWVLFGYNYYFRFLVSAALIAAVVYWGGGGKKKPAGIASVILLIVGGSLMFNCLTVFADDNGWSESGKTIGGLMHNDGFFKSLVSAFFPVLFWDLGILLGWPLDDLFPPLIMDDIPIAPAPPTPPVPPRNPYDFPERPKEWSLNDEGDVSFIDPITGKRKTYGLVGYDENGNPQYIGENGSYYDLDELLVSYDNAVSHTEYYQDANKGLQEWLEKQRAENQKLSRDGMQYLEDKWKWEAQQAKEEKEAEQLFKMWQKYGGELDNKESIKKAMEKAIGKAEKDAQHYKNVGEFWDKMTTAAEVTEKLADYSLTGLSIVTGNTAIKQYYDVTKNYASKLTDAYVNDKSMQDAFFKATVENLADVAGGELGDAGWHFTGNIGSEVTKKVWSNLEEGKDWNDGLGSAVFTGTVKGGLDKIADKINTSQQNYTNDTFRRDLVNLNRSQNNGMSKDGVDALKNLRYKTWANNKQAEKALKKATDTTNAVTKEVYDQITNGMEKYDRNLEEESRKAFLKEVADRKAEYAKKQREQALRAAEKELKDHRDAIRKNAQKPL